MAGLKQRKGTKTISAVAPNDDHVRSSGCFYCARGSPIHSPAENPRENGISMAPVVSESRNGGQDVWDAAEVKRREAQSGAAKAFPEHLVIMVNGIIGNATNWRYAADQFVKRLPDKVVVHCSQCNSATKTFDGVDKMGNRLAEEVKKVIENRPGVKRISFVSHSLGGLVSRYAIGVLYEPPSRSSTVAQNNCDIIDGNFNQNVEEESKGKIAGLEPVNFITFATPHLGSRGKKQLPFACGLPVLEKAASHSAHWFVGRTGRHLFLTDKDDGKPPLLCRLVTDFGDLYFMSALRAFKRHVAYSNVSYDHMVGWRTASIRRQCELPQLQKVPINEKYPHIVNVEIGNDGNSIPRVAASKSDHITDAVEEEMVAALTQLPWERVDVSFHKTKQRFFAHSTIQVKWYWLHSEGSDVISHLIDNFVVQ